MVEIALPKTRQKVESTNPRLLVISAPTKCGKTTSANGLDNNLIIDLEKGSAFVEGFFGINLYHEVEQYNLKNPDSPITPLAYFGNIISRIKKENEAAGKKVYDFITLDTSTGLLDIALELARIRYKKSPTGLKYNGTDLLNDLEYGQGYSYLANAFESLLNSVRELANRATIVMVHPKTASIKKEGKDLEVTDLALVGKTKLLLCKEADAIGWMYRKKNQNIISFKQSDTNLVTGCRPAHLREQEIVISTLNPDGTFTFGWDKIFI